MINLRMLGGLDLRDANGHEVRPILSQPKRFTLLAYLAQAGPGRFRRRDSVVALFWPELDQEHARGALRQSLRFLRRVLGAEVIVTRGEEEIGLDARAVSSDVAEFDRACDEGRAADALELYRGTFLEGLFVSDAAPELEQWLDRERTRLGGRAATAAWALAEGHRAEGDTRAAAAMARRAAGFAIESEAEVARLIRFLDALGDRASALAAYDEFARRLRMEYDADPSPETQALVQSVRDRTVPAPGLPAATAQEPSRNPAPSGLQDHDAARGTPHRFIVSLAVLGLLAVGAYLVAFGARSRHLVVAVLPIRGALGQDSAFAGLEDEATNELITDLAQVSALQVINTPTMMRYRDSTPQAVVRERGAHAVVVSRMRPQGDSIHMTVQVVLAESDQAVWARSYDGSQSDVFRMQRDVARAVTEQVRAHTSARERAALGGGRAVAPEALAEYVRGRFWWNRRKRENLFKAIDAYNQALEIEPLFAPAYAGMADAYVQLGYLGYLRPEDAFPKAQAAARQALELDSSLAAPHATLAYASMYYDWDWPTAEREYREAIARNRSYATAHEWYGLFLAAMGRFDEAQAQERLALDLDPLSIAIAATAGWVLHYAGEQDQAEAVLRSAVRTDSTFGVGQLYLGRVLQFEGKLDSALAHFARTGALRSWIPNIAGEGYVYAQQGRRAEAFRVLQRLDSLSSSQYVTSYAVALVYTALGDHDQAFAYLERSVQERTHWLLWLNRDLRWDPLRADPRFASLVRRVGLPD